MSDSRTPTGVLRETAAGLIAPALARGGSLEPKALIAGLERLASLGITSIGAMIGYGEQPSEKLEAEIALVERSLEARGGGVTRAARRRRRQSLKGPALPRAAVAVSVAIAVAAASSSIIGATSSATRWSAASLSRP